MPVSISTMPGIPDVLSAAEIEATSRHLADLQMPDGQIPWFPGGHCDAWNHVEAAMALTVTNRVTEAQRAYQWHRVPRYALHFATGYLDGDVQVGRLVTEITDSAGTWPVR